MLEQRPLGKIQEEPMYLADAHEFKFPQTQQESCLFLNDRILELWMVVVAVFKSFVYQCSWPVRRSKKPEPVHRLVESQRLGG